MEITPISVPREMKEKRKVERGERKKERTAREIRDGIYLQKAHNRQKRGARGNCLCVKLRRNEISVHLMIVRQRISLLCSSAAIVSRLEMSILKKRVSSSNATNTNKKNRKNVLRFFFFRGVVFRSKNIVA